MIRPFRKPPVSAVLLAAIAYAAHLESLHADPVPLSFSIPAGVPTVLAPGAPTPFTVRITPAESLVPGSPTLFYRYAPGPYSSVPMTPQGGDLYTATLPPAACGDTPRFYLGALHVATGTSFDPLNGQLTPYAAAVGTFAPFAGFNFQTADGWTVSSTTPFGVWSLGTPNPACNRGEPTADFDGSGMCFITGPSTSSCITDVDFGSTALFSPVFNLTGLAEARVRYARWYSNTSPGGTPEADAFRVDVSSDGGANWELLETVGPNRTSPQPQVDGGWHVRSFRIADYVPITSQVRIRFYAEDAGQPSVVEAAIDDFSIGNLSCNAVACTRADLNADGAVNGRDIARFTTCVVTGSAAAQEICAGDLEPAPDGMLDPGDIPYFVNCLLSGGCP